MPKPVSEMMTSTAGVLKPGGRLKSALERINPNAAGIDIGANFLEAIPKDRAQENIRTFGPSTRNLHRLADWLAEHQLRRWRWNQPGFTGFRPKREPGFLKRAGTGYLAIRLGLSYDAQPGTRSLLLGTVDEPLE